jgi:hypothetical protein
MPLIKVTPDIREEILFLHEQGLSQRKIADAVKVSPFAVFINMHPEKRAPYNARVRETNKATDQPRKWYQANRDRKQAVAAEYYQRNKESCIERSLKYKKKLRDARIALAASKDIAAK